jgi:hypothetical protein
MNEKIDQLKKELGKLNEEFKNLTAKLVATSIRFYPLPDLENPSISLKLVKKNSPTSYAWLERYIEIVNQQRKLKTEIEDLRQINLADKPLT